MARQIDDPHVPAGEFERTCPVCNRHFRTDDEQIKYCSLKCKKKAANRRYYLRNRKEIIQKVLSRRGGG